MIHTHPGISRAEIVKESGLSKASISTTVTALLDKGLLIETQIPSGAGRRRIGLQLNHQAGLALGVEITPERGLAVLTDLSGRIVRAAERSFEAPTASHAARETAALVSSLRPFASPPVGLGASVRGLIDAAGQTALLFAPQAWAGEAPLASLLSEQLDIDAPITLINTYHAGAMGEYRCGAGRDTDDMIFVSIGDSIGAGFVLSGELYPGSSGSAGELGHIVIDPTGPRCTCGNIGCLEALAGGPAVIDLANKALKEQGRDHLLTRLPHSPDLMTSSITLHDVVEAATAGDLAALAAVRQAGEYLGLAVAGLVNTMNPRRVVIGGELAETGDTLIAPLRQAVLRRASPAAYSSVEIVPAALGSHAAVIGAAVLAIDQYVLAYS